MEHETFNTKEEEKENKISSDKKFVKLAFLIFGIGGLLSWNAILADLSFFMNFVSALNPPVYFPFLNFFLNIIFQFILLFKNKFSTYKKQLLISISLSAISLIFLPISVVSLGKNSKSNIIITTIMILLQGFLNAITVNSFFGLVSYFPIDIIISMSSGQGIAGILMNFIQYIVLFFIGDIDSEKQSEIENDNISKKGGIIFFSISVIIILICLGFIIKVYSNKYFKKQLILSGEYNNGDDLEKLIPNLENETETENELTKSKISNYEISFLELTKLLLDINILTSLLYIGTFAVFPGCCLQFTLYKLTKGYNINTIGTLFNVFDTIGRSIASYFNPTKKLIYIIVLSRFILLFLIPLNFYFQIHKYNIFFSSTLFIFFLIILSITNGLGSSLVFAIAPTLVPDNIKGKAGSSVSFYLMIGIFLGTICGLGMNLIMEFIKK